MLGTMTEWNMYKKISNTWIVWPLTRIQKLHKVHNPLGSKGLNYYTLDWTSTRALRACLPDSLQDTGVRIFLVEMTGDYRVHAHVDTGCRCAVNYYIRSGRGTTQFYNINANSQSITEYDGHGVADAWDRSTLEPTESFVAQDRTAYLLDTQTPHDVSVPPGETRRFLQWGFKTLTYHEVAPCFE